MPDFKLVSPFKPTGDQPKAIDQLTTWLDQGHTHQTLLGATGTGKTFTMAAVIERLQRPTLILAHNKTLAAQLCSEFREFFPDNAVEYFVSYYDYFQPEAYIPRTDTYIAKDSDINEEIDKLRHAATRALFTRRDVLIVASVSCIYGLGEPEEYQSFVLTFNKGEQMIRNKATRRLIDMQYERNDMNLVRGKFRLRGDSLTIHPAYEELAVRVDFWGDQVERIVEMDPLTGEVLAERDTIDVFPAKHFVTSKDKMQAAIEDIELELTERLAELKSQDKILEAARLEERTRYDLESMREFGYCSGVENYSRHLARRPAGSTPWTLLDYLPHDWLLFVDESHNSLPQVRGMFGGDRSRKTTLVDYGFRLPSALDNRPLNFDEFSAHINQAVYVSATPTAHELALSGRVVVHEPVEPTSVVVPIGALPYSSASAPHLNGDLLPADAVMRERVVQPGRVAEQVIRPTGLLDPTIDVRPTRNQIDDLLAEIQTRIGRRERVLVTTLTKKMAEDLADYLQEMGIKTHYLHSEVNTLERLDILRDLRLGIYDVIVGINLLREGLDLPEVSLVAMLDADKEGYLRSETSLIQTTGRAARHVNGHVIMYADRVTGSMRRAIDETYRRRAIQQAYNDAHGITPEGIQKAIKDINENMRKVAETRVEYKTGTGVPKDEIARLVKELESQMKAAAKNLEFEKAALLRDQIVDLRRELVGGDDEDSLTRLVDMIVQRRKRDDEDRPLVHAETTKRGNRTRRRYGS
ncbi:MAG: excinuclease ABC subunit UvrB [Chloroflexi bacterium]|nr:excinuclease ABC subunit UvrB [Chloroflexota bacterium]